MLADATTGDLKMRLSRHFSAADLAGQAFIPSQTVIGRVWREGVSILTHNALEDPALAKSDSVINYALRSILCVPLHIQGERVGVLYLDNRLKAGHFRKMIYRWRGHRRPGGDCFKQCSVASRSSRPCSSIDGVLQRVQSLSQVGLRIQGLNNYPELFAIIGREMEKSVAPCVIALLNSDATYLEIHYPPLDEQPPRSLMTLK